MVFAFVPEAGAQQSAAALNGVFNGTYNCGQGSTDLKLSLVVTGTQISALFTFYLPAGTGKQGYTYSLHGQFVPQTEKFSLVPVRWETEHPANFSMVGLDGVFDSNTLTGTVLGSGCSTFRVERNQVESANMTAVIAAQKKVAAPPK